MRLAKGRELWQRGTQWVGRLRGRWFQWPELSELLVVLAVVGSVWVFAELADAVVEGETQKFDEWIVDVLRDPENPRLPRGPDWLREAGRDLTALGGITVLSLMTMAAAAYLLLQGKTRPMWLMLLAVVSGVIVSTLLKEYFDRDRPPVGSDLAWVTTSSFPSGHSMLSAVVYLVLGAMLARAESLRRIKIFFLSTAMLLTFAVGVSRVYLGVHYPTDVLGGWTAGLCWALVWWLLARYLRFGSEARSTPSGEAA